MLILLLIQLPWVQDKIRGEAVSYLEEKIGTKVKIGYIEIGLPKKIIVKDFYFQDQSGDTLASGDKIALDIGLFQLLNNRLVVNSVELDGITAKIKRDKDSVFNFDYIIKAFDSGKPKDTTSSEMAISLDKVQLDKIRLVYQDEISKNDLSLNLNHFDTRIKKFDLKNLEFHVPKINLDGLKLQLKQGELVKELAENTIEIADSLAQSTKFNIKVEEIDLKKIDVFYDNAGTKLNSGLTLNHLEVRLDKSDIQNQDIAISSFNLDGLNAGLTFGKKELDIQPETTENIGKTQPWNIKLKQLNLQKINLRFDDENSQKVTKGIDYKHLLVEDFSLNATDFAFINNQLSGKLNQLQLQEKSGLKINELQTEFFYGNQQAYLKNLKIVTPKTIIQDQLIAQYNTVEDLSKNLSEVKLDISLKKSQIAFSDILIFVPNLSQTEPFKGNPNSILHINTKVFGKVSDLEIPYLELSGIGSTKLAARARLVGLPDVSKTWFDLDILKIQSTAKDLQNLLPPGTIPSNIQLPSVFTLQGDFKGKLNNLNTDLRLTSSFGNAKIKAKFDSRIKDKEIYDAHIITDKFQLGKLLKNAEIGTVSLDVKAKGKGLNPKTAQATIDGKIKSAIYNKYQYKNLLISGNIANGDYAVKAKMDDPNINFQLVADGRFEQEFPSTNLQLDLNRLDLQKLGFTSEPLAIQGEIQADFDSTNPDALNGQLLGNSLILETKDNQFLLDTLVFIAHSTKDSNQIHLNSQVLRADIDGKFSLTKLASALQNTFNHYYQIKPKSEAREEDLGIQRFEYNILVKNDPMLLQLLPDLKHLDPINLRGNYNYQDQYLRTVGTIPKIVYGENTISGGILDLETRNDKLEYILNIDQIDTKQFQLPDTQFYGTVAENKAGFTLRVRDVKGVEHYMISGDVHKNNLDTRISLNPNGLVLNYEPWKVDAENYIQLGETIIANAFNLTKDDSQLKIQSQSETKNAPIDINFVNFEIGTFGKMLQKSGEDAIQVEGKIQGPIQVTNITTQPIFTTDLKIENFILNRNSIGDVAIKIDNKTDKTFQANLAISGFENDVVLDGTYELESSKLNFNLDLKPLQMKTVQAFSFGNLSNSEGFLSGKLAVTGTAKEPHILGNLQFNGTQFNVKALNSKFGIDQQNIAFTSTGIAFDKFSITDQQANDLVVNGNVLTTNYRDFGFDLNIRANNFQAVNSKENDSDLFYGKLFLNSRLTVQGDLNKPIIGGTIKVNDDTALTVVLPQNDPGMVERDGVVEFIDQDNPEWNAKMQLEQAVAETKFKGMEVNVNIEIDKDAELSLVIDKGNGDYLKLKGEARLNGGIDASGKTSLTGRYELMEGSYEMSFNLIKRKFDIQKGSYLLWTGEPTSATIDITAVYTANTAPIDLIGNQMDNVPVAVQNTYKQRLPFQTLLKMKGELLKPEISFDIQLPDKNYGVASDVVDASRAKLDQLRLDVAELNKQVFALLLLNRFIGENPFASEAGGVTAESMARQSVSKILSDQLNNLAGDVIPGIELDFNLESTDDYTTGQRENRTDMNIGLSKKLLNDRLKVTVGSNFNLEGPQQANEQTTNIAGDVAVDYMLTRDGRYSVRAYRKNEYQVALQGQVVETGVAFIITMDYNLFRELFKKSAEERRLIREEKKKREQKKAAKKKKEDKNNDTSDE